MTALHLARGEHFPVLAALVGAFHAEHGIDQDPPKTETALRPLLDGSPHGAIYLIGPAKAPIGYVILSFGWSIEFGGLEGFVDELYIRPGVRGRGIASEVLTTLPTALADAGLRALHLEVASDNETAQRLYRRCGFKTRDGYLLMTRHL